MSRNVDFKNQIRKCSACEKWLSFDLFWIDKNNTTGFVNRCKDCYKQYKQSDKYKEYRKNYHKTDQYKAYHKNYEKNLRVRTEKDLETRRKKEKRYRLENELYKLKQNCSRRIRECITKKTNRTIDYLGCSINELKLYLESKFQEGMTWDNYGLHGWHIDHIIPVSSAKEDSEVYKLFHYTNLQPLWAKDNLKKSNKYG